MKLLYSSRAAFKTCDPHLHRELGVTVSEAFEHRGLNPPQAVVEIESEAPATNTTTTAKLAVPAAQWKGAAVESSRYVLRQIDAVIAELTAHRERLMGELQELTTGAKRERAVSSKPGESRHDALIANLRRAGAGSASRALRNLLADVRHVCDHHDLEYGAVDRAAYNRYLEQLDRSGKLRLPAGVPAREIPIEEGTAANSRSNQI